MGQSLNPDAPGSRCLTWPAVSLGYMLLAVVITWPLALGLSTRLLGFGGVDAMDTAHLRGAVADLLLPPWGLTSQAAYWPVGFQPLALAPNILDHLLAAPFVLALPFPLADNLWWLLVLAANGWAGHRLGFRLGGGHAAGVLVGVAWATAEPIMREANLHHAPQALSPFPPLYLLALLESLEGRSPRERARAGLRAGLHLALASLVYWYNAIFLLAGSLGLAWLHRRSLAGLLPGAALCLLLVIPPAVLLLGGDPPAATAPVLVGEYPDLEGVPAPLQMVVLHGGDPLFPLQGEPVDRSNRVPVVLALAALLGAGRVAGRRWWGLLFMGGVGYVMALGPLLKLGEGPVVVSGGHVTMPFLWLADLHPYLARLHWPERWGLLIPLAALPLAARAPRPLWLAGALLVETLLFSANLPLSNRDHRLLEGWRNLSAADGAVLELPLGRMGLDASFVQLHQRYHGRRSLNPMLLPPGRGASAEWRMWVDEEPLLAWLKELDMGRELPPPGPEAATSLRAAGLAAIALDVEPGGVLSSSRARWYRRQIEAALWEPHDYGVALVWWLQELEPPTSLVDGEAWRRQAAEDRLRWQRPRPKTIMRLHGLESRDTDAGR